MHTSASVTIGPVDSRCRYWAKIVRASEPLPLPSAVLGGNDLPGVYLLLGDEELFPGDVLFEGEELDHKRRRGWDYCATVAGAGGPLVLGYSSSTKAELKQLGLDPRLLAGAGDLAGLVRVAHGLRAGLCPYDADVRRDLTALWSAEALNAIVPVAPEATHRRL